jgi:hypothetical protein
VPRHAWYIHGFWNDQTDSTLQICFKKKQSFEKESAIFKKEVFGIHEAAEETGEGILLGMVTIWIFNSPLKQSLAIWPPEAAVKKFLRHDSRFDCGFPKKACCINSLQRQSRPSLSYFPPNRKRLEGKSSSCQSLRSFAIGRVLGRRRPGVSNSKILKMHRALRVPSSIANSSSNQFIKSHFSGFN